jgi:hypothetical protein
VADFRALLLRRHPQVEGTPSGGSQLHCAARAPLRNSLSGMAGHVMGCHSGKTASEGLVSTRSASE